MSFILFADDQDNIRQMVELLLCQSGHEVALANDGADAMEQLAAREPDLLILDWMMPHLSGVEICAMVKKNPFTSHIPVLMLTARSEIQSKVEGFEAGADDYLGKPFEPARIGDARRGFATRFASGV